MAYMEGLRVEIVEVNHHSGRGTFNVLTLPEERFAGLPWKSTILVPERMPRSPEAIAEAKAVLEAEGWVFREEVSHGVVDDGWLRIVHDGTGRPATRWAAQTPWRQL